MTDQWIVIPSWDRFQHRDAARSGRFVWLRDYADQLHRDEYRDLTFHQRGLLRDIRHSYASTRGQLRMDTVSLGRRFGQRVFRRDVEALVHAGFLEVSASRPPALIQQPASLEGEEEVKPPTPFTGKPAATNGRRPVCPHCGLTMQGPLALADHVANVHYDLTPKGGDAP